VILYSIRCDSDNRPKCSLNVVRNRPSLLQNYIDENELGEYNATPGLNNVKAK